MEKYVKRLKDMYDEKSIIIFETLCVPYFVNKDRNQIGLYDNSMVTKYNQSIRRGYKALRERLPNSHVVEFPLGVLGDGGHKWGKHPLHYIPEYYDYGLDALNIITELHLSIDEERNRLSELKEKYEMKIKQIYEPVGVKSIRFYQDRDSLCSRMQIYESYMKELLMNMEKIDKIKHFFIKHEYSSCAFYGLTELSKLLICFMRKWDIHVDYIVEERKVQREYESIPIVQRSATLYPETRLMIIADVLNVEKIKNKLASRKVNYYYCDVFEIFD